MLYYFLFGVLFSILSLNDALDLIELRNAHNSQTLTGVQLDHLARRSNVTNLNTILDNICIPRVVGTSGHDSVHNYIVSEMSALGWDVEVDSFQDDTPIFGTLVFRNIIATTNPTAERYLIFACHYDSKYFKNFDFIGATDSAVPCAMMINLAFIMRNELSKNRSDLDIKFLFLDGEEAFHTWGPKDSIYGARHLATKYGMQNEITRSGLQVTQLDRIDLFVLLDLLGAPNPSFYSYHSDTNKWYIRLIEIEQRLKNLGHLKRSSNYFQGAYVDARIEDDHIPFLQKGVPILHLIPTPFPKVWHTKNDNRAAVDIAATDNLNKIFRAFVAEYLHLDIDEEQTEEPEKEDILREEL